MANLSATALCSKFDPKLERKLLIEFLISEGYISDIKTATPKGLSNGVVVAKSREGGEYLTYNEKIQQFVEMNLSKISPDSQKGKGSTLNPSKAATPKPKKDNRSVKEIAADPMVSYKRPEKLCKSRFAYIGIPNNAVIVDTETTGIAKDDEIIELAILDLKGKVLYNSRFSPSKEIAWAAQKVNKLTKADLANEPKFGGEVDKIISILGTRPIIGHNVSYDKRLFVQTMRRYGIEIPEGCFENTIDTKSIAKKHVKSESYGLNDLTNLLGITREEQHNAADDCLMTLQFMKRLNDIMRVMAEFAPFVY